MLVSIELDRDSPPSPLADFVARWEITALMFRERSIARAAREE
jgi:hypothetical protein